MGKNKIYAVRKGRKTGIFNTWKECQQAVTGYSGAEYKSFNSIEDAKSFLKDRNTKKDLDNLHKDIGQLEKNEMIAYVDGSYDSNSQFYSYGVVIFYKGKKEEFYGKNKEGKMIEMRNVAGEITGAKFAINYAINNKVDRLYLYYDYEGIAKWALGDWKANKDGTKEYKEFYNNALNKLKVVFNKVKAHSGDKYNEEADQLAKRALLEKMTEQKQKSSNQIHLVESKVNSGKLVPIFNIITSEGQKFDTDKIINEFKNEWKRRKKYLKDMDNVNIVIDCKRMKVIFTVTVQQKEEVVEIELNK